MSSTPSLPFVAVGSSRSGRRRMSSSTNFRFAGLSSTWVDVYVANDTNASLLFHNKHDGTFEETGVFAGAAYNADGKETSGMGVAAADYNADGWLDIFKTNFSDESASLYRGTGEGLFIEDSEAAGVGRNKKWAGWGCGFADFDNDGWPDLFVVNGHVYPEIDKAGAA